MKARYLPALRMLIALSLLTGVAYPLLVTFVAHVLWRHQAQGSLIARGGRVIGSELVGQYFGERRYFWSRPSVVRYNPLPSGGSNLGPAEVSLQKAVNDRRARLREANGLGQESALPEDLLFASGSGLDPHISPAAARLQIDRIAAARGFDEVRRARLAALVAGAVEKPQFGFLGSARVNVLRLNLALDSLEASP